MSWNKTRAEARIRRLRQSVPVGDVAVENFSADYFPRRMQERALAKSQGKSRGQPIIQLPYNRAVMVEGVHIYANLVAYDDYLVDNDTETESSHRRALQFLQLHYAACDALVREFDIQRVDYHGSRLHAVVLTPTGADKAAERATRAIAFAEALSRLTSNLRQQLAGGNFGSPMRIGIDSGSAVAINSGRGAESEPLFLGNPANYAAKLADGDVPGVYLSDRIRHELGQSSVGGLRFERESMLDALEQQRFYDQAAVEEELRRAGAALQADRWLTEAFTSPAFFRFFYRQPPLSGLKFKELMPSRSVRMPLVSIFADLDGFTRYVDDSIASGTVAEMVARMHVTRGELAQVLRDDFGGKKIRYIGDCLHGVVAVGSATASDASGSIDKSVRCAGGLRSSFELCNEVFGNRELGLGIGFEFGDMPVTRFGDEEGIGVRCATGRAVSLAEEEQHRCNGTETAIGPAAYANASVRVKSLFERGRKVTNLHHEDAVSFLDRPAEAPAVVTMPRRSEPTLQAHTRHR